MNDEIKEILDYLKSDNWEVGNGDYEKRLYKCDIELLFNYITNLQQENEYLDKELNNMTDYAKDLEDYKSRCEKAIEYIKNNITWYYDEDLDESVYQDEISGDKVLNILQNGSENDEN